MLLITQSAWKLYFKDTELREMIQLDVNRTFPELPLFQSNEVKESLQNILLIWSKLNPDTSYRQGMHEITAILFFVVHSDRLDYGSDHASLIEVSLMDSRFVEHDTAALFFRVMRSVKLWYDVGAVSNKQGRPSVVLTKIGLTDRRTLSKGTKSISRGYLSRYIQLLSKESS